MRLWLDDELIIDHWDTFAPTGRLTATVYLTDKAHSLRLEYYEDSIEARCIFAWAEEEGSQERVVPSYALYHTDDDEREAFKGAK